MDFVNGIYSLDKSRLAIPYGEKLQRFDKLAKYMNIAVKGLGDNTVAAMTVAKALYVIRAEELYKDYPIPGTENSETFHDFFQFCNVCFKAKKSTVYNNLQIYERFGSEEGKKSTALTDLNAFTYTQLSLMLPLSDAEIACIKPDWSCSQIKKHVKEVNEKNKEISNQLEILDHVIENTKTEVLLNNDDARAEFIRNYKLWGRAGHLNIVETSIDFYCIEVFDKVYFVVAECSADSGQNVALSYYIVDRKQSVKFNSAFLSLSFLSLEDHASLSRLIEFLRVKKIKSVVMPSVN